jgi:hypothetical protein
VVGCGSLDAVTLVMGAADGRIVATITQVGGSGEVWYNPGDQRYYLAAGKMTTDGKAASPLAPVVGVIDARTNAWVKNVPIPWPDGSHTLAVDPKTNRVFVACRLGGLITLQVD